MGGDFHMAMDKTIAYLRADELAVRVHLIGPDESLPTETVPIELRYSDLPASVSLQVPTRSALAAMKTAARVLKDVFGQVVVRQEFDRLRPSIIQAWEGELERLMREIPRPEECLRRVRGAYAESLGWGPSL